MTLEQAVKVKGATYPNPPVGAVILDSAGQVAGVGATEPPGGAHAEIVALRRAGTKAQGGTAVVTLEPCNHFGRTPPCVDALLRAGVAAVAYGVRIATRLVADGIRGVSSTTVEAAHASGITGWQMIRKVQIPMARESLVLATNQGLLYVLSVVVIGGLVGGGSLGYLVVSGFSQDQLFGKGLAAGIAITALGVMLDRVARYSAARYGRG